MKKLILILIFGLSVLSSLSAATHVKTAYAMKKYNGDIYVIRVLQDDGYHDWYVRSTEYSWLFYGYESDEEIIVDIIIDIAIDD